MTRTTARRTGAPTLASTDSRALRRMLMQLDQDQADLERARDLLRAGRELAGIDPRGAFELIHRAALRGAGVLVARANRERRRALPLNVWAALTRLGGVDAARAEQIAPLVKERERLDRSASALPDPELLHRHAQQTAAHLDEVAERLLEHLPTHVADLAGPTALEAVRDPGSPPAPAAHTRAAVGPGTPTAGA